MAKIIKVGSQNPTFTSQKTKKASPIHTHRNSNEATNPFKFTNFEGNTLQFADVFEGFKPSFKATPANKMRMIASSVTGSMTKMRTSITEPIIAFAKRVGALASSAKEYAAQAWDYATSTTFTGAISDAAHAIKETRVAKKAGEILLTPIEFELPSLGIMEKMSGLKEKLMASMPLTSRQRYANMSVEELRANLIVALAEGGAQ